MTASRTTVGILGASGYAGLEALRVCSLHPNLEVVVATGDSMAGTLAADLYPSLRGAYGDLVFAPTSAESVDGCDVVFCAMPHGASQDLVPDLVDRVGTIVDLAADFRLRDPQLYPRWYGEEHRHPELLAQFVYGMPELNWTALVGATKIAAPGCYVTAASLAIAPLVQAGLIERAHILDGRISHVLLVELFTDTGIGTMITEHPVQREESQ